jgi:single-stranded DNA-specific DHH superfamily exonuclease
MRRIDVFNGDADGLCALRQLRLAEPAASELVTGVKRDIALLERAEVGRAGPGDLVTVLDVSLDRNRAALLGLLERGARVRYFDHHYAGAIPSHPGLEAHIDASPGVCTSILVDRHLGGRFRGWAVAAASGTARQAALDLGATIPLGAAELEKLRELGRSLNYNAYGETEADLLLPPARLYGVLSKYEDPLQLVAARDIYDRLNKGRHDDLEAAAGVAPRWSGPGGVVLVLPEAAWSRRVSGTLANHLAGLHRRQAVAVLAPRGAGYVVSLRVPAGASCGADEFCRSFPGGGGRKEAAGIDLLPAAALDAFVSRFADTYG